MGRIIRSIRVGPRVRFESVKHKFGDLAKIEGAEIYWGNGTIAVVASQEWCDYLSGNTDVRPEPQGDDTPFEFNEQEFMRFIGLGVKT